MPPRLPPLWHRDRLPGYLRLAVNGLLQALAGIGLMLLTARLFDALTAGDRVPEAGPYMVAMASITLGVGLLRRRERIDGEALGQGYVHRVRLQLFDHWCRLHGDTHRRTGVQMLRFINDLGALRLWLSQGIPRLLVAALCVLPVLAVLFWLDWHLGAALTLLLSLCLALSAPLGRRLQRRIAAARRKRSHLANNIGEKLQAVDVVRAFGQQRREQRYLARQSRRLVDAMVTRAGCAGDLRALGEWAVGGSMLAILATWLWWPAPAGRESSTLVAALAAVAFLAGRLRNLSRVYEHWNGFQVSRDKLERFLSHPAEPAKETTAPISPRRSRTDIELQDLSVGSRLGPLNGRIRQGEKLCLTGPSGSGKSTLIDLLAGLIPPTRGRQLNAGQELPRMDPVRYRRRVGLVSRRLPLLRGTLRKNLRYRRPRSEAHFTRLLPLCGVDTLIDSLPGGMDFIVQERGRNLSGEQRLSVELVRALAARPALLLLDDLDTYLAPDSLARVRTLLAHHRGTLVFVSDHPALQAMADRVWSLLDGRLTESPTPRARQLTCLAPHQENRPHVTPPA